MNESEKELFIKFYIDNRNELDTYQKNICAIIYRYFDEIKNTSYRYGQRTKLLVQKFKYVNSNTLRLKPDKVNLSNKSNIKKITSLHVEDFRGFQTSHVFDLDNKFTFIYGRNGTGKSSFSEAIEFSLLGYIEESRQSRIDTSEYIKNIYSKQYKTPILMGIDENGQQSIVKSDPDRYKFAIIEKNRIENFARISAETDSEQQARLSVLVGLDEWNRFVRDFPKDISSQVEFYDVKEEEQQNILKVLATKKIEQEKITDEIKHLYESKDQYLTSYHVTSFSELEEQLDVEKAQNEKQLKKISQQVDFDSEPIKKLNKLVLSLKSKIEIYDNNKIELSQYKQSLSLGNLYKAILSVKDNEESICPACQTPIYNDNNELQLVVDPYENATNEQLKLQAEIQLENEQKQLKSDIEKLIVQIQSVKVNFVQNCERLDDNELTRSVVSRITTFISKLDTIQATLDLRSQFQSVTNEFNQLEQIIQKENNDGSDANIEFDNIQKNIVAIIDLKSQINLLKEKIKDKEAREKELVLDIHNNNHDLLRLQVRSKKMKKQNDVIDKYIDGYKAFFKLLKKYSDSLPIKQLQNLNQNTLDIYNLINKYDDKSEILSSLALPATADQVINISFEGHPNKINALDVLSEGHIRVLGLSILLAEVIKEKLGFIVFDDVVNAIDDDHRMAIAELITSQNGPFSDIQWIVTTHGAEFDKQLVTNVPLKQRNLINEITFLPKDCLNDINTVDNQSKNYLIQAKAFFENDDMRNTLAKCRQEVEVIMYQLWKLYDKRYHERISISVNPINPIPETNNVLSVLLSKFKKKLNSSPLEMEIMQPVLDELTVLLDSRAVYWTLLNKGTHESYVEELDRDETQHILQNILEPLDQQLLGDITVADSMIKKK